MCLRDLSPAPGENSKNKLKEELEGRDDGQPQPAERPMIEQKLKEEKALC